MKGLTLTSVTPGGSLASLKSRLAALISANEVSRRGSSLPLVIAQERDVASALAHLVSRQSLDVPRERIRRCCENRQARQEVGQLISRARRIRGIEARLEFLGGEVLGRVLVDQRLDDLLPLPLQRSGRVVLFRHGSDGLH